jgi:predicted hydrocarbon binding protein/KaiC/GvpD/RAD55 family RecA-like ATPase
VNKSGFSLAEVQEIPKNSLILLTGPPGAGKSTFCHQVVLNDLVIDRPVIFVTTEQSPSGVLNALRDRGLGAFTPGAIRFVDGFTETVGLACTRQPDTLCANCADLNSLSITITRQQERMEQKSTLLVFDSLTSPYLFCGAETIRFMRLFLSKFAAEGNAVLALMDEGCGKEEDLVAMMSVADGIIRMEIEDSSRIINVVKHPRVRPKRIEVTTEPKPTIRSTFHFEPSVMRQFLKSMPGGDQTAVRKETGDFVNLFWPNLAHWGGMLWDPKRFPMMIYELNKEDQSLMRDQSMMRKFTTCLPWHYRLFFKLIFSFQALGFLPKNFSKVRDMKKWSKLGLAYGSGARLERCGIIEYLDDISKTDEHYFRIYESSDCWGFENVGATIASHLPPAMAGQLEAFEKAERVWNTVETKCIGLGDPYCEFKLVPGEIDELKDSLEKDSLVVARIHERLLDRLIGFLLDEKPLVERPRLGSDVHLHVACHAMGFPHLAGERYQMAQRMGGAKSGKEVGERLMGAGLSEQEALKRVIDFMNYCKVGKVTLGETVRIKENVESLRTSLFTAVEEPSCYFTTGFLNGLFSSVKNQHVREVKCMVAGDSYCEWAIV